VPHRGTATAWRETLRKVIKSRYVYEFDLKGFFNNVDTYRVIRILKDAGMPADWASRLSRMCSSPSLSFKSPPPHTLPDKFGREVLGDPGMRVLRLSEGGVVPKGVAMSKKTGPV
jgi:hypothetical protein